MQRSAGRATTGKLSRPSIKAQCVCGDVQLEIDFPARTVKLERVP